MCGTISENDSWMQREKNTDAPACHSVLAMLKVMRAMASSSNLAAIVDSDARDDTQAFTTATRGVGRNSPTEQSDIDDSPKWSADLSTLIQDVVPHVPGGALFALFFTCAGWSAVAAIMNDLLPVVQRTVRFVLVQLQSALRRALDLKRDWVRSDEFDASRLITEALTLAM